MKNGYTPKTSLLPRWDNLLSVDTESTSDGKLICITASDDQRDYIQWAGKTAWIADKCADPSIPKVFANAKYDLEVLRQHGIIVCGDVHDVILMAKALYELWPSYSLKNLMYYYLGDLHREQLDMETWLVKHGHPRKNAMEHVPRELIQAYGTKDAHCTRKLALVLLTQLIAKDLMRGYEIDRQVIRPVWQMEQNGINIDRAWVSKHYQHLSREVMALRIKATKLTHANFNLNSVPQIATYLKSAGIDVPKTEKGNPSLTKQTAKKIQHPLVALRLRVTEVAKQAQTYCANLLASIDKQGKVRPNFNISLAATRRFSSSGKVVEDVSGNNLNWQNFPPVIRRAVTIPPGRVGWFFDYKQIENVIHIFFSGDAERRKIYEADPNWSEYLWLAEKVLGEKISKEDDRYKRVKSTKLGMNYGMGWRLFAKVHDLPGDMARRMFNDVYRACPAIRTLQKDVAVALQQYGFVEDVFGYRYHGVPDKAYKVVAYLIQGCAAALMKSAIIRVAAIPGIQLHLTVHDELFISTADTPLQWALARRVRHAMTDYAHLFDGIPIRVEAYRSTTNWADKQLVNL